LSAILHNYLTLSLLEVPSLFASLCSWVSIPDHLVQIYVFNGFFRNQRASWDLLQKDLNDKDCHARYWMPLLRARFLSIYFDLQSMTAKFVEPFDMKLLMVSFYHLYADFNSKSFQKISFICKIFLFYQ